MKYKRLSIILIVVLIAEMLFSAEKFPAKD